MSKKPTQYKRNKYLAKLADKHFEEHEGFMDKYYQWRNVLKDPSVDAQDTIADVLTRHGYEPDEIGIPTPIENWPRRVTSNPLMIMDGIRNLTLEERANLFEGATLIWADAINEEEFEEIFPNTSLHDAKVLISICDFKSFWSNRRGKQTPEAIRELWNSGESIFHVDLLKYLLKSYKDGGS